MPTVETPSESTPTKTDRLAPPGGGRFDALIFDMGSTLLEFDNIPWSTIFRISVEAVHRRLQKLGHTPSDIEILWERFHTLLDNRRKLIREEMREYHIGPLIKRLVTTNGVRLGKGDYFFKFDIAIFTVVFV